MHRSFTQSAAGLHRSWNGSPVTRYPNGKPINAVPQTALLSEPSVARDRSRGDAQVYDLEMHLAASDAVTTDDVYEIDGEQYRVHKIGRPVGGLRPVQLKQTDATVFTGGRRA